MAIFLSGSSNTCRSATMRTSFHEITRFSMVRTDVRKMIARRDTLTSSHHGGRVLDRAHRTTSGPLTTGRVNVPVRAPVGSGKERLTHADRVRTQGHHENPRNLDYAQPGAHRASGARRGGSPTTPRDCDEPDWSTTCAALVITIKKTRPYGPQANGKIRETPSHPGRRLGLGPRIRQRGHTPRSATRLAPHIQSPLAPQRQVQLVLQSGRPIAEIARDWRSRKARWGIG